MEKKKADIIKEYTTVCLTTNSLNNVLKLFVARGGVPKYQIVRLRANASDMEDKSPVISDDDYGIKAYLEKKGHTFNMDYKLVWDDGIPANPKNPIDEYGVKRIERYLHEINLKDAAVEEVQVLVWDTKIGKLANVQEDLFHMTLISNPEDGDMVRNEVKKDSDNEALINEHGFKYRVLDCRELIDFHQENVVPEGEWNYIIYWERGRGKIHGLKSPELVARHLNEKHFGEKFGLIKTYGVEAEDKLVLLRVER